MVVIAELDAGFVAGFAGFVEEFGSALVTVGGGALRVVDPGADYVFVAEDVGGFDGLRHAVLNDVVGNVDGRGRQAVGIEERAKIFGRAKVRITGEFDLLVTDFGDLGDGAGNIGAH